MSDPAAAAAASLPTSVLATVKLVHVFGGIYIWEFVTSLDFEVEVYTRKRPWRWSLLVYIAARVLAMGAIITEFFGFDYPSEFNCNVWLRATLVFSFAAIMLSSLMILLRGVAVWGRSIYVVVFSSAIWLGNVAVAIWTMSLGEAVWFPPLGTCAITGAEKLRTGILVDLFADVILLTIMLAGVMNKRNGTGLWRVLYIQGLSWFLIAVCSKIPPIVMGFLNIDVGWNLMFNTPHRACYF
ncbi:hypothetical protein PENSPDRAFT_239138 [Peniophora sp. CONT]|nr:hypothetical protein PENSPDRAFT_239138 [Peniophora sp. CONT]